MKRISLTIVFVLYQLFIPFVLTRCGGEDVPYDRTDDAGEEDPAADEADCDPNGIITADCVKEVTEGLGDSESDDSADDSEDQ